MNTGQQHACFLCGGTSFSKVFSYDAPPAGEILFAFSSTNQYRREIWRCEVCGHFISVHEMDDKSLYAGDYISATYGDDGIRRAFERITALDPALSDNVGRARHILEFARVQLSPIKTAKDRAPTVLDVGSGLCVFLHRMKEAGWEGTALDPDARAVSHAREVVGVHGVCGNFMEVGDIGRFDLITFNKVLEHVTDPVTMLKKSAAHLGEDGVVYIELPDGEAAAAEGPGREEFFIDHHHIFSLASLSLLAVRAGFSVRSIERLREPSTKYTLRAFLVPAQSQA